MAEYIGGKPRKKGKGVRQFIFVLIIVLLTGSAYVYFNYIWPQCVQQQALETLINVEELSLTGCKEDDTACQMRLSKAIAEAQNNPFSEALQDALGTDRIKKHLRKAHTDGSICFLVDEDSKKTPDDGDLTTWLDDYGSQKFLNDKRLIARARQMYEARYLKPTPELYQMELLRRLRWRHLPFGKKWRDYSLAARFLEWSALTNGITAPAQTTPDEERVMKAMKKNSLYFTDKNIERLTGLAKRKLTQDRLEKIKTGIRRFRNDVREYPLNDDRTKLILGWLAARDDLHPWLKRRWQGPYVEKDELVDLWECPIVGTRVPENGSMKLTSYASDCSEGGDASAEDIALAVTVYTPPPQKTAEVKEKPKPDLKLHRRKKRRSLLLP